MRIGFFLCFIIALLISSCTDSKQDLLSQKLNENWQLSEENDTLWMPATVPGTVQTDLLNLGKTSWVYKIPL